MPRLPIYENQDVGLRPSDRGTNAVVGAARRISRASDEGAAGLERVAAGERRIGGEMEALGRATGAEGVRFAGNLGEAVAGAGKLALDYATHREVSRGAKEFAETQDSLTNSWNEMVRQADPNDPSVAAKFRETVLQPTMEKFGQGFMTEGGQKYAETRTAQLRTHFFEKTTADMMTLAGQATANNVHEMANRASNTAMRDPSAVPHLLRGVDTDITAMVESNPNIKGVVASKAKLELTLKTKKAIVQAGVIGAMKSSLDPEKTAEEWAAKYPAFLDGKDLKALSSAAKSELRYRKYDDDVAMARQKQLIKETSEAVRDNHIKNLYSDNPAVSNSVTIKSIVNDQNLQPNDREHLINVVNRQFKPETKAEISNRTFTDMLSRMRLPDGDPDKLTSLDEVFVARAKKQDEPGSLNAADMNELRRHFTDLQTGDGSKLGIRTNEFLRGYKGLITKSNPMLGNIDPSGDAQFYLFQDWVHSKVAEYRQAKKNVYDLFDPSKPDYVGKPEALEPFQKSLEQSTTTALDRFRPKPPQAEQPPVPGARKGQDNEWYVEIEPGKWGRVKKK